MAKFGTVEVYQELAQLLNDDPVWLEKGKAITYSMAYTYTEPVNKTFFLRFESGKVTDVRELPAPDAEPVDFLITGSPDVWRGVLTKEINATSALTRGQLKLKGKMTTLLRHMPAFSHIIDSMTNIKLT